MKEEKIKIYHNPRCSKSRCAIGFLEESNNDFEVIEYLKDTPSTEELKALLKKLGMKAEDILRKGESVFKENFKGKKLSEEEWIEAMIQYPKLIERPIVVRGNKAVVARPTEKIKNLLD